MNCTQDYKILDKPQTLETMSFLLTKWESKYGGDLGSSILKTYGCSLTPAFDQQEGQTFISWEQGQNKYDALLNEYKEKGYKTREELGIVPHGVFHDEEVISIRQQLWSLHFEEAKKRMYIPPYGNSPDNNK